MSEGLEGIRVLDFSEQIAGPYCSKLFVDGGADVIKVERPEGDSLRRWSATGGDLGSEDSALFSYLNAGKRSVVGSTEDAHIKALLADADLVIEAHGLEYDTGVRIDVDRLRSDYPHLVVLSITPYGLAGPWAGRRATEFTLQAESGSLGMRGVMGGEPFQAGGRISEWAAGVYGAASALTAVFGSRAKGQGVYIDLSILETANFVYTNFSEPMNRLMNGGPGDPEHAFLAPTVETPSIEPTADGYVGFCTNSRQQFSDFLVMIERPELREDEELAQFAGRLMRFEEWNAIMREWLKDKHADEIVELASLLRIPVAHVCNGKTLPEHEHLKARGVFAQDADGRFVRPRRPYRINDADPPPPRTAPRLGADTKDARFSERDSDPRYTPASGALPLSGLRVLDMTGWWAGPASTHLLATFGAEVIHVESIGRVDGLRLVGGMMSAHYSEWWEACPHFLQVNTNKLDVTLDLTKPEGLELLEKLIGECDAVVENFTPRVVEQFGLTWERVHEINPEALMMRMPAFGLSGPWRDYTGFAQTMEQMCGMAWVTGHAEDQPRIPRGPCDPIAGMHGAFALLVALAKRAHTDSGHLVESTMIESALNVAAEAPIEYSAYGNLMEREGNRSSLAAPQGLYPCEGGIPGMEQWLAISICSDEQWSALRKALGEPAWVMRSEFDTHDGRRAGHAELDEKLREWTRTRPRAELAAELREAGIPASEVADPCRLVQTNPQLRARRFFETPEHRVVGAMPLPSWPFRVTGVDRWLQTPAPTVGQHNAQVLGGVLGLPDEKLRELEESGVIGTRPTGL